MGRDCIFCNEFLSRQFKVNIPVREETNFFVMADIAPVAFGHLIILPKRHFYSLSELDLALLTELRDIVTRIANCALKAFDRVAFAEHGSSQTAALHAACVEHAHLHVCPVKRDPIEGVQLVSTRVDVEMRNVKDFANLAPARGEEYLLWGSSPNKFNIWKPGHRQCSQLLRGVLNTLNGRDPTTRWQTAISTVKAVQAAKLFRHLLSGGGT
jgi:diadenosine tetraphosphate (Ap4A) HIT family hydrolase